MNKIKLVFNRFVTEDEIRINIEANNNASSEIDKVTASLNKGSEAYSNFSRATTGYNTKLQAVKATIKNSLSSFQEMSKKINLSTKAQKQLFDLKNKYKVGQDVESEPSGDYTKRGKELQMLKDSSAILKTMRDEQTKSENNVIKLTKEYDTQQKSINKLAQDLEKAAKAQERLVQKAKSGSIATGKGITSRSFRNRDSNFDGGSRATRNTSLYENLAREETMLGKLQILWKKLTGEIDKNTDSNKKNGDSVNNVKDEWSNFTTHITGKLVRFRIITSAIQSSIQSAFNIFDLAASYEESLNLYTVSLGEYAKAGRKWADEISSALYLDETNILQYTGALFNLVQGLGVTSDAAYTMSTNLTQLAYDMSSYLNIDAESAFEKLQSAITGQSRAVASAGIAMQQASLQELAYTLGIEKKVATMTQAEKTYLRYIQIMRSTTNMQGDLARTIVTPENAMRVIQNQFKLLGRAIGQVFIPIVMKAIPYIMVLTETLTNLAKQLASWAGYEIAEIDYSGIEFADTAMENLGDTAEGTGKSISRTLAAFDDLNVVESSSKGTGGVGKGGNVLGDLEKYITGYDMLDGLTSDLKKNMDTARKSMEKLLPVIRNIAMVFSAIKLLSMVNNFKKLISELITGSSVLKGLASILKGLASILKVSVGTAFATVAGFIGTAVSTWGFLYDVVKNSALGIDGFTKILPGAIAGIGSLQLAVSALIGLITKNPWIAIGSAAIMLIGDIVTYFKAQAAAADELATKQAYANLAMENAGIALKDLPSKFDNLFGKYSQYAENSKKLNDAIEKSKDAFRDAKFEADKLETELLAHNFTDYITEIDKIKNNNVELKNSFNNLNNAQRDAFTAQTKRLYDESRITIEEYNKRVQAITIAYDAEKAQAGKYYDEFSKIQQEYAKTGNLEKYSSSMEELRNKYSHVITSIDDATGGLSNMGDQIFKNIALNNMSAEEMKTNIDAITKKYEDYQKSLDDTYKSEKEKNDAEIRRSADRLARIELEGEAYKGERQQVQDLYDTLTANNEDLKKQYNEDSKVLEATYTDVLKTIQFQLHNAGADTSKEFNDVFEAIEKGLAKYSDGKISSKSATKFFETYMKQTDIEAKTTKIETHMATNGELVAGYFIDGELAMIKSDSGDIMIASEETGKYMQEGFENGISDPIYKAKVRKAIEQNNTEYRKTLQDGLEVHSPSAFTEWIGQNLNEGLIKGIQDKSVISRLNKTLDDTINVIKNKFKNIDIGSTIKISANVESSFNTILKKLQTFCNNWRTSVNNVVKGMRDAFNSIKIENGKLTYTAMPKISVPTFEQGGFPTSGDLFFANENGIPEYITSIGNRSAVANQDQMVAALSGAIITAMSKIPINNQPGVTQVYIGNDKVYEGQGTYQSRQTDRYGTNYIKI